MAAAMVSDCDTIRDVCSVVFLLFCSCLRGLLLHLPRDRYSGQQGNEALCKPGVQIHMLVRSSFPCGNDNMEHLRLKWLQLEFLRSIVVCVQESLVQSRRMMEYYYYESPWYRKKAHCGWL
jgi:hypothetical protein